MDKQIRILAFPLLAFLVCFSIVSVHNRFAADDFEFLNKLRDFGWMGSVKWFHEHWNTRWAAIGILNGVLLLSLKTGTLWWYHIFCMILVWFASFRIIRNLTSQDGKQNVLLAGYFSVSFFYCCFSISDVFFWVNTSAMYLLGSTALLLAIGEVTLQKQSAASYLRLTGFSIFIGGAYEPLVFTCLVTCIVILVLLIIKHRWKIWHLPFSKKIIIFLIGLMFGFTLSYLGEGHVIRASYLPQTSITFKIWVWIKAIIKMFFLYLPGVLPAFLLGMFPWMLQDSEARKFSVTRSFFIKVSIAYFLLVIISLLPVAFVMSEMGPERAWTQISLYTVIYSLVSGVFAGNYIRNRYDTGKVAVLIATVATVMILFTGVPAVTKAIQYSRAYDNRMSVILNAKSNRNSSVVVLQPLPDPGWIHSAELDTVPTHFNNLFIKDYLKLPFDIKTGDGDP